MKPLEGFSVIRSSKSWAPKRGEVWSSNTDVPECNRPRPRGRPAKPLGEDQDPLRMERKPAHAPLMRVVGWEPSKAMATASTHQGSEGSWGPGISQEQPGDQGGV